MKQLGIWLTALVTGIFLIVSQGWARSLVLATDTTPGGEYIRGGGKSFDKELPGIEIELYRTVAEKLGLDLEIVRLPWKLCLQKLKHNQVDGIFPASFKQSRLEIGRYPMEGKAVDVSRKTRDNAYFLYTLEADPLRWDGQNMTGQSGDIGVPPGWAVVEDMRKMGIRIREVSVHENSPGLLLQKKLQGFICLETVFDAYLARQPQKYRGIVKSILPIWEKPYYLMLSNQFVSDAPELSEAIWDEIKALKASDWYAELWNKYSDQPL